MHVSKMGFLAFAAFAIFASCGNVFADSDTAKEAVSSKASQAGWTTFTGSGGKVQMSYPPTWVDHKSEKPDGHPSNFLLEVGAPDHSASCNLSVTAPIPHMTAHAYKEGVEQSIAKAPPSAPKMTKISDRFVTVDGDELYERFFETKTADGKDLGQFCLALVGNDRIYQVILT